MMKRLNPNQPKTQRGLSGTDEVLHIHPPPHG
jgi:hypothetical protein